MPDAPMSLLNLRDKALEPDTDGFEQRALTAYSLIPPKPLELALGFVQGMDDVAERAKSVELSLKSGVDAEFAREYPQLVSDKEAAKHLDLDALEREASTTMKSIRQQGLIYGASSHIRELSSVEKRLRLLDAQKAKGLTVDEDLSLWDATGGAMYQGVVDIAEGYDAIHRDVFTEIQSSLRGKSLDDLRASGVDENVVDLLQDIKDEDFDDRGNFIPRPEWLEDWEKRKGNTGTGLGLVADVFHAVPSIVAPLLGGLIAGPIGAGLVGASLFYGYKLRELNQDPKATDRQRNREAAMMGAFMSAPLEAIGATKLFSVFRPSSSLGKAMKAWGLGAAAEGGTEYLQSYPDLFATEYARGLDPLEKKDMQEFFSTIASSEFQSDAAYQGLVGLIASGGMGAVGIGANRKRYAQQAVNIANSLQIGKDLPETYSQILRAHIEEGNVEKEIYMPAETIESFFQSEASITQDKIDFLAKSGIDQANYESALATGGDVAVPFENIHKVLSIDTDERTLFQSVKMTPKQESVMEQSGGQTKIASIVTHEASPEEKLALETLMQGSILDPETEARLVEKQKIVDALLDATDDTQKPYTASQANAYADVVDAWAVTRGQSLGISPLTMYREYLPQFMGANDNNKKSRDGASTGGLRLPTNASHHDTEKISTDKNPVNTNATKPEQSQSHNTFTTTSLWQEGQSSGIVGRIPEGVAQSLPFQKAGDIVLDEKGVQHIEEEHGDQIRKAGFENVQGFVEHVMQNVNAIYEGKNTRTFHLVVLGDDLHNQAVIRLVFDEAGDFYRVSTAGPRRNSYLKNKKLLWGNAPYYQADISSQRRQAAHASGQSNSSGENVRSTDDTVNAKALHQDASESLPVIEIDGSALGVPDDADIADFRKAAKAYHDALKRESEHGKPVINKGLDKPIRFSSRGWKKNLFGGANKDKWKVFPRLRDILEKGKFVDSQPITGDKAQSFVTAHWLEAEVIIDGHTKVAGVTLLEDNKGNLFYNLGIDTEKGQAVRSNKATGPTLYQDASASDEINLTIKDAEVKTEELPEKPRAAFDPANDDSRALIRFFEAADITSAGHEIGHFLRFDLEWAASQENAPDWLKKDWETACAYVKAEQGQKWTREQEEHFADAFTNYLDTAKAPSKKLTRAFRRLRQWFTKLYMKVTRIGVNPSPAMRKVFDRVLALESEIKEAKSKAALTPMIAPENAPEHLQQSYIDALQNAEATAVSAIETKMLRELRSERVKWQKEAREVARMNFGQIHLDDIVEAGGIRLDEDAMERYGKETIAAIRQKRIGKKLFVKEGDEGGIAPEVLADRWNFHGPNAVDSLFAYLEEIPSRKALQDDYIAKKTAEWEQSWQSDEIVLTDQLADMLEVEAQILADGVGQYAVDGAAIRKATARNLALMEMGKLETQNEALKEAIRQQSEGARQAYAERMAKRESETRSIYERRLALGREAMADEALRAKERQRRAVEEVRQRTRIKEKREKLFNKVRRMARAKDDKLDFAYAEQMRALALRFGMVTKTGGPRDPKNLPSLSDFLAAQQPDFATDIPVPEWLLATTKRRQDWKKLTVQQFEELANFMTWLDHQARDRNFWRVQGEKIETGLAVGEMVASMQSLKSKKAIADYERKQLFKGAQHWGRELLAEITSMEWALNAADGHTTGTDILDGAHDKYILQPLYKARSDELALFKEIATKLDTILKPMQKRSLKGKRWKIENVPLPQNVQREWGAKPWNYERILMVALNMGNDGNKNALMKGFGWTEEDLKSITAELSSSDWHMVQEMLDLVDSLYPHINGAYERVNGVPMKKVEASPIETPFGKLRGGYFPLVFDQKLSGRAAELQEEDLFKNHQDAMFMKAAPASGFTKDRKGGTLPPRLSMSVITQHLTQSVHYASHAEAIRSVSRIIKDGKFAEAFTDKFGESMYHQLNPWLRHIARPDSQVLTRFEKIAEMARHMATIQGLGLKFTSAAMQLTSIPNSVEEIGGAYMARGLTYVGTHRSKAIEEVKKMSPMMRDRAQSLDRDLAANLNKYDPDKKTFTWEWNGKSYEVGRKELEEAVFVPMQFTDSIVATATWHGAYQKAMVAYDGDQAKALAYADRAVVRAQAAGHPINLTAMQRAGGIKKFMTMFMTFTMNLQNKTRFYASGVYHGNISVGQYTRHIFYDLVLPTVINTALMGLLKSGDAPDEPEEYAKDLGYYILGGYPIIRDLGSFIEYGMSPGFTNSLVNKGIAAPFMAGKRAYQLFSDDQKQGDEWEKFIKASLDAAGFWVGIPTRPVWQFIDGARDIYAGTTSNPLRLFVKEAKKD